MRIAILWESCGPYHFSRLSRLRELMGFSSVFAIELSSQNSTYAWKFADRDVSAVHSLFPAHVADQVRLWPLFKRLRQVLRAEKIDVFFVPSYWPSYSLVAALAAKSVGVRLVFMGDSHYASGSNRGLAIIIKRLLIRLYDSALIAGSIHRSFLRYLGMPVDRIFDGYDTVDNRHFEITADAARREESIWRNGLRLPDKYILNLGRFVPKKNLETVIAAYAELVDSGAHHGHDLVFVGSGAMQSRLIELAHARNLTVYIAVVEDDLVKAKSAVPGVVLERRKRSAPRLGGRRSDDPKIRKEILEVDNDLSQPSDFVGAVHFYPFSQIETVPVYYALATAFVLASTSDEWGLVVNEAMACSCPVIVSRSVGSSLDLVVPEVTGFRFTADNAHELRWCLEKLCQDPDYARKLGIQANQHIAAWSNDRFAANAMQAAEVACGRSGRVRSSSSQTPFVSSYKPSELTDGGESSVWFLQTCFPDYRMPVFQRLHERLGERFHLFSGTSYFTEDIKTTPDFLDWHSLLENRFIARKRFLWQMGAIEAMFQADVVIMELNPRIISNWIVLAGRALWGAPTLLWGHAWGRDDAHSIRNVLRLYMMRLASGTITYTRTQRDEVRRVFPHFKVYAATNSLIRAAECRPQLVRIEELDTIIYVGRIIRPKKLMLLLEAFRDARLPSHVQLKVVGSGQDRVQLERFLELNGAIAARVKLLGHLNSHELLKSLYAKSFCAVSPGYVGLGAIQAFSFGVPLVLADKEPHAPEVEACREGENTLFFKSDDAASLATALEQAWTDRAGWLSKREGLAAWTAEHYSVEAMVEGFMEAIDDVSNSAPGFSSKRPTAAASV